MLNKQLPRTLIIVGMMIMSACSSKFKGQQASIDDANASGVYTQGIGDRAEFGSQEQGELYTTKVPHNQVYLFAFDNAKVAKKYIPSIEAQAQYLSAHPNARVMLAGHTDRRGSREYNIGLGERRAKSVYNLLRLGGAHQAQLRVVSYGKERPVAFADDAKSDQLNRRVELIYEAIR